MSFIVVQGQDDHEQADAVLRGVADGLARLFSVPDHPPGVRDLLDSGTREESARPGRVAPRRGGSKGPAGARSAKSGPGGTLRGAAQRRSRTRGRRAKVEVKSGQRDQP
ncbi:hypothetical protein CIW48_03710 [Methylobacterium sp. P1-11]|nr:hypothetical protein CIW48_03710 [Methylobacterium sp. P1-11]